MVGRPFPCASNAFEEVADAQYHSSSAGTLCHSVSQWTHSREGQKNKHNTLYRTEKWSDKLGTCSTFRARVQPLQRVKPNRVLEMLRVDDVTSQSTGLFAAHWLRSVPFTAPLEESMGHIVNEEQLELMAVCFSGHSWAWVQHPIYAYYLALSCSCYQLATLYIYGIYSGFFQDYICDACSRWHAFCTYFLRLKVTLLRKIIFLKIHKSAE